MQGVKATQREYRQLKSQSDTQRAKKECPKDATVVGELVARMDKAERKIKRIWERLRKLEKGEASQVETAYALSKQNERVAKLILERMGEDGNSE